MDVVDALAGKGAGLFSLLASPVLAGSVERHCVFEIAGCIVNANLAFAETAPFPRVVELVLFRIRAGEVWLHARCFERLPAAAVWPDFNDTLAGQHVDGTVYREPVAHATGKVCRQSLSSKECRSRGTVWPMNNWKIESSRTDGPDGYRHAIVAGKGKIIAWIADKRDAQAIIAAAGKIRGLAADSSRHRALWFGSMAGRSRGR